MDGIMGPMKKLMIIGFFFSMIIPGVVSADVEPNDPISNAEEVGEGMHNGMVSTDPVDVDYYYFQLDHTDERPVKYELYLEAASGEGSVSLYFVNETGSKTSRLPLTVTFETLFSNYEFDMKGDEIRYFLIEGNGMYRFNIIVGEPLPVTRKECTGAVGSGLIISLSLLVVTANIVKKRKDG